MCVCVCHRDGKESRVFRRGFRQSHKKEGLFSQSTLSSLEVFTHVYNYILQAVAQPLNSSHKQEINPSVSAHCLVRKLEGRFSHTTVHM